MNPDDPAWQLIGSYLEGTATPEQIRQLDALLLKNAELRDAFLRYARIDAALAGRPARAAEQPLLSELSWENTRKLRSSRFRLSPMAVAAAAGVVFGMFCSSMVWAYVVPMATRVATLLDESFESGSAPRAKGMPIEPGVWSGDLSEIAGEQLGVKPKTGNKMLRFLRSDFPEKVEQNANYYSDVYRLIDLRTYRHEFADGGAAVHLSAAFNAFAFSEAERYSCSVAIHALGAPSGEDAENHGEWAIYSNSLAMVRDRRTELDRNPSTWQRVHAELVLPQNTEFLMIRISVDHKLPTQRRATFDGHYLDDVKLTLLRRAPLR
jgi:hypothetical protein